MTGPTEPGAQGAPLLNPCGFGESHSGDVPVDAAFDGSNLLIQFPCASVVMGSDGAIKDAFPTCGLRSVVSDGRYVLLTQGGRHGHFGAAGFVRDLETRSWLKGDLPSTLPPYVAGTGGLEWSVVVDVSRGRFYQISPNSVSSMCGQTFNSACGEYVWDSGDFVLEAATGLPVLDASEIEGDLLSFAITPDGWRFLFREAPDRMYYDEEVKDFPIRLVDELGGSLRDFDDDVSAAALSR